MKLETQITQLYARLDRELDHYRVNERFYSARELMERFGVNKRVLDGTLRRMAADGLLRCVPRVGIFSNVSRREAAVRILLATLDWPGKAQQQRVRLIEETVRRHPEFSLKKVMPDLSKPMMPQLDLDHTDVLLAMRPANEMAPEDLRILSQRKVISVFFNSCFGDTELGTLSINNIQGGMLAAQCLLDKGHRKLLAVVTEYPVGGIVERLESFVQYAKLHGATVDVLDCGTHSEDSSLGRAYDAMTEHLKHRAPDYTAVFVLSDFAVPGVVNALRENGIAVPQQMSVIGFDGSPEGADFDPALTSIAYDFKEEIRRLFAGLQKCLDTRQKFFHALVPMYLVERSSVLDISRQGKDR